MARKRKISESSSDAFVASDSEADDAYTPKAAGSSRKASTKIAKKTRAPQKRPAQKKPRKGKDKAVDASDDDDDSREERALPHASSTHTISSTQARSIRTALLAWYDTVHEVRGMPWRKPFDHSWSAEQQAQRAYEVWISEIMLQQTQVVTVIPYYNKWMAKFPTLSELAKSDIDTVNGLWKGLGYYSRAARILQGAQKAVTELGGQLPDNAKDMEAKIPGIGRYSAGAICSIAYNQCVPVLDGNVHRLLSRFLALYTPPKAKQGLDILWEGATALIEGADRAGDTNQALIELGSTVCKVHDPLCGDCPIQPWCKAYAWRVMDEKVGDTVNPDSLVPSSEQELPDIEDLCVLCRPLPKPTLVTSYPMKVERKKAREELDVVSVIEWRPTTNANDHDRWFLLVRRPEGGLLAGLHEFPTTPNVSVSLPQNMVTFAQTALHQLIERPPAQVSQQMSPPAPSLPSPNSVQGHLSEDDLRIVKTTEAGDVLHIFSHIRKTYRVQWVLLVGGSGGGGGCGASAIDNAYSEQQHVAHGAVEQSGSGTSPPPPSLQALPPILRTTARPEQSAGSGTYKSKKPAATRTKGEWGSTTNVAEKTLDTTPLEAKWVRMNDVSKANVGTGVLKVWKQVQTLWRNIDS
ncbi:DNA glycosylase [Cristinia sonorae]|uniref:Adenine DNA glycosylase n=1 Tax=Cristinia sonorae TaxID=1940300 RepID=A0A8K0UQ14_9AGAR|nr:DNA glycosylase [Cristinia sonorae]